MSGSSPSRIRIELPTHLRTLASVDREIDVVLPGDTGVTARVLFDALEARHPVLRGTIRHRESGERRAYLRFFAGGADLSHDPPDAPLPEAVARGEEVFRVVGAIAGG